MELENLILITSTDSLINMEQTFLILERRRNEPRFGQINGALPYLVSKFLDAADKVF